LLVTAVSTGCRRGELLALEWRDIDFQTGMISISKSLEQTKKRSTNQEHQIGQCEAFPMAFGRTRCSQRAPREPTERESF
jgi:Phage integrase family